MKTVLQCDFDGTLTVEDVGFMLLELYGKGDWEKLLEDYKEHRINVDEFNTAVFAMIKADKQTLVDATRKNAVVRKGLKELVDYCKRKDYKLVIVSNGLEFYIQTILEDMGMGEVEFHAAKTEFHPDGLKVRYIGLDGSRSNDGLKEAYIKSYLDEGCRVIYLGNGDSDIYAARHAHQVIARDFLLSYCAEQGLNVLPFEDLHDVIEILEKL